MTAQGEATSASIDALAARVRDGDAVAAEAEFWARVTDTGAPLIEPIEGDADHFAVTFLWHGDAETRQVVIISAVTAGQIDELLPLAGTSVWHYTCRVRTDVRSGYQFAINQDLPADPQTRFAAAERISARGDFVPDPLNPRRIDFGVPAVKPISTVELPAAPEQPWLRADPQVPAGRVEPHRFESRLLGNSRPVWTYLPAGYSADAAPYPLLVLYDGFGYLKMDLPTALDNLIAAGRMHPTVVAMVHQLDRLSELFGDERFAECIAHELTREWLPARYNVTSSRDDTAIGGVSAGGYGAMFAALRHTDVYGGVLSQSGSFFWGPGASFPLDTRTSGVEWHWLIHQFEESPAMPLRVYMDAGELEVRRHANQPDLLGSNRRMRDALQRKSYALMYQEFAGGHDYACWRGTVADGLMWLFGDRS